MKKINILIADDHEIIHSGLEDILKIQKGFHIVGHAYNGIQAVEKSRVLMPDIVFMDIAMPEMNGIDATKEIQQHSTKPKIIALSQYEENEYVVQFLAAGGSGYLLKNSKREEFIRAINTVLNGKRYLSYELSNSMLDSMIGQKSSTVKDQTIHLTRREIEIIKKIAEEKNNQEIADDLIISLRTVETHRRNIMQKLNAKSVVSLLKYASQHKLIDL